MKPISHCLLQDSYSVSSFDAIFTYREYLSSGKVFSDSKSLPPCAYYTNHWKSSTPQRKLWWLILAPIDLTSLDVLEH